MNMIYATYNIYHNSIDIYTYAGYFLQIDSNFFLKKPKQFCSPLDKLRLYFRQKCT